MLAEEAAAARLRARSKWSVLASAVAKNHGAEKPDGDKRGSPLGLLTFKKGAKPEAISDNNLEWFDVAIGNSYIKPLKICLLGTDISAQDLIGFNNTGNVRVWPSEECLSVFCLENPQLFEGRSVVELGGGMTALAGLVVASQCRPRSVVLTDGNARAAANLERVVEANRDLCAASAAQLHWNEVNSAEVGAFDVAICADCLFFDEARQNLRDCLWRLLRDDGQAIIVAPKRGTTFDDFVRLAKTHFNIVRVTDQYCEKISRKLDQLGKESGFAKDIHYPILLEMRKIKMEKRPLANL